MRTDAVRIKIQFRLHFRHEFLDINEDKVIAAAKAFGTLGLTDAGYEYVNIDVSFDPPCFSSHLNLA